MGLLCTNMVVIFCMHLLVHGGGVVWPDRPAGLWQPWLAVLVDVINVELPYVKRI